MVTLRLKQKQAQQQQNSSNTRATTTLSPITNNDGSHTPSAAIKTTKHQHKKQNKEHNYLPADSGLSFPILQTNRDPQCLSARQFSPRLCLSTPSIFRANSNQTTKLLRHQRMNIKHQQRAVQHQQSYLLKHDTSRFDPSRTHVTHARPKHIAPTHQEHGCRGSSTPSVQHCPRP